jgi:hypothetical protein
VRTEVCLAIQSKKIIKFYYKGGTRFVEPFCYGIHRTTGNEVLRGYQIGGYSESGETQGWKLYRDEEISELVITDDAFSGSRPNYNPNDKAMRSVYCSI